MIKKLLFILSLVVSLVACRKSTEPYVCNPVNPSVAVPDTQMVALQNYIAAKGLIGVTTRDDKDFYYKIDVEGTGVSPNTCSNVKVAYQGKLANDTIFTTAAELANPRTFLLNELIAGWQLGLQKAKKGGKITLYLPPALGYGASGSGPVPRNAILVFEISLLDVTN